VTDGMVVAHLVPADAPLLDPRARAEQEARLHASEAMVAQAAANVGRAKVTDANARDDLARKRQLGKSGAISTRELEQAEADAASRAQDLASAEFGAKVADHQLTEARAALERGRTGRVDEFPIVAPAAGQVLRVLRESEGVVTAGTQLLEVGDLDALEISVDLLTVEAVKVRPGMSAFIDHWGGERTLEARVRTVDPSGFTKVSALGVEEQRVHVLLDLGAPPDAWRGRLGDSYRVEAHIVVWNADAALRVPTAALFHRDAGWAAYVIDGSRAHARTLELGAQSPDVAAVTSGLREGDRVVLRPGEGLVEDTRVEDIASR